MLLDLELPKIIYVDDYHEFRYYEIMLQSLNSTIRVREIDDVMEGKEYVGVIYVIESDFDEIARDWYMNGDNPYRDFHHAEECEDGCD